MKHKPAVRDSNKALPGTATHSSPVRAGRQVGRQAGKQVALTILPSYHPRGAKSAGKREAQKGLWCGSPAPLSCWSYDSDVKPEIWKDLTPSRGRHRKTSYRVNTRLSPSSGWNVEQWDLSPAAFPFWGLSLGGQQP